MSHLLIICGPTATGKTDLALSLAKEHNGELISADSRQVFRGMDIGTGKDIHPSQKLQVKSQKSETDKQKISIGYREKEGVPVWLVDMVDPDYSFHVADYVTAAHIAIDDIVGRGKLPILVGGTGFYIQSVLSPPETLRIPDNPELRRRLDPMETIELQKELQQVDYQRWEQMNHSDRQNPRRLIRAIEVALSPSGKGVLQHAPILNKWQVLHIGLTAPLNDLYARIDARVAKRYADGMVDEITSLLAKGYRWHLPSFSACGYDIWQPCFEGTRSVEEVLTLWKQEEHAYAKRQLTWFKKESDIHWFDITTSSYQEHIRKTVAAWKGELKS